MSSTATQEGWGDETRRTGREKLRSHFSTIPHEQAPQISGWNNAWSSSITPWDRGLPNPALVDALAEKPVLTAPLHKASPSKRPKALVPGCGRGYDVLLLASWGFEAYGLDAATNALTAAREFAASNGEGPNYPVKAPEGLGRGSATFIEGNFFEDGFLSQTHDAADASSSGKGFDLIYDYTFLCALPPALRPRWAERMAKLLAPEGNLVCLEHPLTKDPKSGGPPYGLAKELYEQLFKSPGKEVQYKEDGYVQEEGDVGSNALVRVDRWRPRRGFVETSNGVEDMVSIWSSKK